MAVHVSHAALPYPIKNARFSLLVPYLDADGDPTAPATPDTEISKDNGAAADCVEEASATSGMDGMALITIGGAEMDCSTVALNAKVASGPKATLVTLYPRQLVILGTGTLAAGSAGGGTLGTKLPFDISGCFIRTTGGTGGGGTGGVNNQARKIMSCTAAGVFTVVPDFETAVSTDTTYDILLPEGVTAGMLKALPLGVYGTLSGTHSSTTADLGAAAPANDISGQTLYFPSHNLSRQVDSYNTGTGVATFSPSVAVTLANGEPWELLPSPPASTGAPPTVLVSVGTGAGQINAASGKVPATIAAGDLAANSITATSIAADAITAAKVADGTIDAATFAASAITATAIAADAITAAKIAAGAIDAATFAADVDAEILSYIVDDATRIDASALNTAAVTSIPAILVDTGTTLDGLITTVDTVVDGIKAKTDSITFTVAGQVDATTKTINATTVLGAGTSGDKWRGS